MALMDLLPGRKKEVEVVEPPPPAPAPVSHKGVLFVGGMTPIAWDTADQRSVQEARRRFDAAIMSGYTGQSYKATKNAWGGLGYSGEITRTFDPEAEEVRMSLPYAGG